MIIYDSYRGKEYTVDIKLPKGSGKGLIGSPLFIDLHTHVRYPFFENYETLSMACLKGGFSTCVIQPNTKPHLDRVSTIQIHKEASKGYPVSFLFTSSLFGEETTLSVAYSTDGIPYDTSRLWYALNTHSPKLLMDHAQLYEIEGMFYPGGPATPYRPMSAEAVATARTVMLGVEAGWTHFHIQHVSSPYTVKTIQYLKQYATITTETTPHHLLIPAEEINTTNRKINPPLLPNKERKLLIQMVKQGLIDVLATDHAPHPKKNQDWKQAPYGSSHVEISFSAFFTAIEDLHLVVDMLTVKPAQVIGTHPPLPPDNMVIIDPYGQTEVDSSQFVSDGKNTAFEGMKLKGKIVGVRIGGKWVYYDGE